MRERERQRERELVPHVSAFLSRSVSFIPRFVSAEVARVRFRKDCAFRGFATCSSACAPPATECPRNRLAGTRDRSVTVASRRSRRLCCRSAKVPRRRSLARTFASSSRAAPSRSGLRLLNSPARGSADRSADRSADPTQTPVRHRRSLTRGLVFRLPPTTEPRADSRRASWPGRATSIINRGVRPIAAGAGIPFRDGGRGGIWISEMDLIHARLAHIGAEINELTQISGVCRVKSAVPLVTVKRQAPLFTLTCDHSTRYSIARPRSAAFARWNVYTPGVAGMPGGPGRSPNARNSITKPALKSTRIGSGYPAPGVPGCVLMPRERHGESAPTALDRPAI